MVYLVLMGFLGQARPGWPPDRRAHTPDWGPGPANMVPNVWFVGFPCVVLVDCFFVFGGFSIGFVDSGARTPQSGGQTRQIWFQMIVVFGFP